MSLLLEGFLIYICGACWLRLCCGSETLVQFLSRKKFAWVRGGQGIFQGVGLTGENQPLPSGQQQRLSFREREQPLTFPFGELEGLAHRCYTGAILLLEDLGSCIARDDFPPGVRYKEFRALGDVHYT